ncbi:MAG: DUF2851 family protein [Bacteroidia bacterium]|nr:DUF2851 family protein [Bacteroidia bacterium]
MSEEFLQYIWGNRLFTTENLQTTAGEPLEIIDVGKRNHDSGPDFFMAKIKINDTIWAGNIEIHRKSSGWQAHHHQNNKAYDNVILHVVEAADQPIFRTNGGEIPTLQIRYPDRLRENYQHLLNAKTWIACENHFHKIDPVILQLSFNRLMIDRLENKTTEIRERLKQNNNDWNETFYQILARNFGFRVNALPFEMLAKAAPLHILAKHKNNLFQLEALLFGCSGLLNRELLGDDYFLRLRDEFSFLYKKYRLRPIEGHLWKFLRLRPVNFPTIRISQLAALIFRSHGLFSRITDTESFDILKNLFTVKASEYWETHYNFNKNTENHSVKNLGEDSINNIIINTIAPLLFVYGELQNKHFLKDRALNFLELLPPEQNSIITRWENLGVSFRSAFETQAVIQLKNRYCEKKKCLNCPVGVKLVNSISVQEV